MNIKTKEETTDFTTVKFKKLVPYTATATATATATRIPFIDICQYTLDMGKSHKGRKVRLSPGEMTFFTNKY